MVPPGLLGGEGVAWLRLVDEDSQNQHICWGWLRTGWGNMCNTRHIPQQNSSYLYWQLVAGQGSRAWSWYHVFLCFSLAGRSSSWSSSEQAEREADQADWEAGPVPGHASWRPLQTRSLPLLRTRPALFSLLAAVLAHVPPLFPKSKWHQLWEWFVNVPHWLPGAGHSVFGLCYIPHTVHVWQGELRSPPSSPGHHDTHGNQELRGFGTAHSVFP